MSYANVEKLAEIVMSDSAMATRFAAAETPDHIAQTAIAIAHEQGLEFSADDATAWMADNFAMHESGELTDMQLQEVAGGTRKQLGMETSVELSADIKGRAQAQAKQQAEAMAIIAQDPKAFIDAVFKALGQAMGG